MKGINTGIQFGHAVVEYGNEYYNTSEYKKWTLIDKTFIVLNGGTTREMEETIEDAGTLNQHVNLLRDNNIKIGRFWEPDLNNSLTAVVFLVDERVWNYKEYDSFEGYLIKKNNYDISDSFNSKPFKEIYTEDYNEWLELIGGKQNEFLKEFLYKFKLA